MKILIFENTTELFDDLTKKMIKQINEKPNLNLGLATGSTPVPLYENLIKAYQNNLVSFKDVKSFNLDEYVGLKSLENSYHQFMIDNLFSGIDIDTNNTYIPKAFLDDLEKEVQRYDLLLEQNPIDIQILGIGSNGHIGFNEPGVDFNSKTLAVTLANETREDNKRFFNSLDEVPTQAITMGIASIMNAKEIILIATGEHKAEAIKKTLKGPVTNEVPASILQNHPNVYVYLDKKAAKLL